MLAAVSTENQRPHRFGSDMGVIFDIAATLTDGPAYRGTADAFIADGSLYMLYFLSAVPYYFDKHKNEAVAIIEGATLQ